VRGSIYPTILDGRAPQGDGDVALGGQTLDRLRAHVGDRLMFRGPEGVRVELTVVGRTLLPLNNLTQDLSVGEGALIDRTLLDRIGGAEVGLALVDLAPGTAPDDLRAALQGRGVPAQAAIVGPTYTADLRGYDAVRNTPLLLAALLALLGLGVLAHTITQAARRRRRELAILRYLGFVRRDLRATVRWNALTIVGVCIIVAVPIGVGIGRTLWTAFADGIGVLDDPVTPASSIGAVVVVTIACALGVAALPGQRAGRVRPAEVLRSE
jgi:putative ABC transport system permease protein